MPAITTRQPISLAIPSSISRDLRTPSPRTSVAERGDAPSPLLLPLADGALSKICGSLIEPESKRQRWACHGCASVFARDATIYMTPLPPKTVSSASPASPLHDATQSALNRRLEALDSHTATQQEHFCRACYTERFALGECFACATPVIGSTKEDGKYVKAGSGSDAHVWHGRCWKCSSCGTQGADISMGMEGVPVCAPCFDRPRPRKHVMTEMSSSPFPSSGGGQSNRRVSPPSVASLSGSTTRQGMGATIAELSRKFGHHGGAASKEGHGKTASPVLPQSPLRSASPTRSGLTRSNSVTNGIRPLTAQFSGQSFNLAAFRPTTPTTAVRSDSRSRSASPTKELQLHDEVCAKCFKGPFEAPSLSTGNGQLTREARMISLHNGAVYYHSECFCCAICDKSMENATLSFVRLEEGRFAHPSCAPPATVTRKTASKVPPSPSKSMTAASSDEHATHQRVPRPSNAEAATHNLPTSYLTGRSSGGVVDVVDRATTSSQASNRRFQPSSGAAPPTRSTLLSQRPSPDSQAMHANASLAMSSSSAGRLRHMSAGPAGGGGAAASATRFARLGGMHLCGGCDKTVSNLEGTPGPRGQTWHRKCLVCNAAPPASTTGAASRRLAPPLTRCGKQLDSSAKVNAEGQLRCRACYDKENARHRV